MATTKSTVLTITAMAAFAACAQAQSAPARGRIHEPIDNARRVRLAGQTHPLAQPRFDRGPAPNSLPMNHMLLLLKRSPEQETELAQLLEDFGDTSSPQHGKWLTPEEFGRRFGVSDQDLQTVTAWLQSNGFQVDGVGKGRMTVEFSGTAAGVRTAFGAEIRRYSVRGVSHWANASDPTIPEALAPVVAGFASLNDFHSVPQIQTWEGPVAMGAAASPLTTFGGGAHALSPADYSVIYNIRPLYQSAVNGAGSTIAVLGRSNINTQDVADFRSYFGLPANAPQIVINGADPGIVSSGEQMEATLDTTWAGAIAPNAAVKLVISASTNTTDGVFLSEQYAIDNNLADVITSSFGSCEAQNSGAASYINSLAQQAAAQGMTFLVAAGDSGSAGCDNASTETTARYGTSVNLMASTPYTTAVGGTQFNDVSNPSQYWSATNGAGQGSALSYIPEAVWNQSCASGAAGCSTAGIWAGGGGPSAIFSKPSWQSGVAGIPADGRRDLPDVSLTASSHDPYLVCVNGSCRNGSFYAVSGTSAAAPSFAGIMALAKQRAGSRLGLVNPVLYRVAAGQSASQCNASGTPASSCAFYDVTSGNNAVPGEASYGTSSATYPATAGYDVATGLGSVNAYNLVGAWGSTTTLAATTTTLTISPATIPSGTTATVSIRVAERSGSGTPTGTVSLVTSGGKTVASLTLSGGSVVANVGNWPAGSYTVIARYSGDSSNAGSDSASVAVTAGSATASLSATAVSFGSVAVGSTTSKAVTLTNSGSAALSGIAVSVSGANAADFTQTNNCGTSIAAGANCAITVTFRPSAAGARSATLNVATGAGALTASLSGSGAAASAPTLTPSTVAFGTVSVGSTSANQTLTLANPSAVSLTGVALTLGGTNPGDFGGSTNCGSTLAAGASCSVILYFNPTAGGARSATLNVATSAGPLSAALSGSGATTTSSTYTVTAPATAAAGGAMTVSWTAPAGHAANDFIGLYSSTAGYWYQSTGTATSGTFTVPVPYTPGTYFVRYVRGDTWTVAAQTPDITVQ